MHMDLTTDAFKIGDLLFHGAGGLYNDDKASLTIKYKSDLNSALEAFETKFPESAKELDVIKSPFNKHPFIVGN
jgi:hypothetical protein